MAATFKHSLLQREDGIELFLLLDEVGKHTYSPALARDEYHRRRALALAAEVVPLGAAGMAAFVAEAERLDPEIVANLRKTLEANS